MTRQLSPRELATLDRALARRTAGRVRVGRQAMTRDQGIALWEASAPLPRSAVEVTTTRHVDSSTRRHAVGAGALLAATASLSACATLGGNVKGDFACRAPDGICAPTTTIDDTALALISGDGASAQPAGPYVPSPDTSPRTTLASAVPIRSNEKVLRIVFPAHIDGAGRFREASAVHAVVERGAWMSANATAVTMPRASGDDKPTARPVDTSSVIQRSLIDLAASAPEVRFPDPVADADAQLASAETANVVAEKTSTVRVAPLRVKVGQAIPVSAMPRVAYSVTTTQLPGLPRSGLLAASSVSAESYSLPPKSTTTDGAMSVNQGHNPMDAIRAQVATQLGKSRPISGPPASPLASATAPVATAGRSTLKPVNGPSLFPVSEVNR